MEGRFYSHDETHLACKKYFSKDYVILSPKLNEHQKKSSPEIEVFFRPKLGEDQKIKKGLRRKLKWFFAKIT